MGCCVDEAGGVTPKRLRRFGLLAPFSLQSFAGGTHAKTPEGWLSGRASFLAHSSLHPLQHPDQTCQSLSSIRTKRARPPAPGQGPWAAPTKTTQTVDHTGGHYILVFWGGR
jgi:hypothetical protein